MKLKTLLLTTAIALGISAKAQAQNVPFYVPTNGLVSWYPFTGNPSDSSGNGNHATVNAAVLAPDRYGIANAAYSFNGSTAYLHGDASTFPSGHRTIALWFYTNNLNVGNSGMQTFGYGGGLCHSSWLMQMDNQTPSTSFFTNNSFEVSLGCNLWITALPFGAVGSPLNPNGNWHHWVATNGPTGLYYYIDGNFAGGVTQSAGGTSVAGKKFFIGSCPDSTGMVAYQDAYLTHWNGLIDDVGIWDRELTQQEITILYNGNIVGVKDEENQVPFSAFPNPAQDMIHIKAPKDLLGSNLSVFDALGKVVLSQMVKETDFQLNLENLDKGFYLIRMDDPKATSYKIMKQ